MLPKFETTTVIFNSSLNIIAIMSDDHGERNANLYEHLQGVGRYCNYSTKTITKAK